MKRIIFILGFSWMLMTSAFAQWNTDRILTIGRNALFFEDYVLSIQYFNQVIKIKPYLAEPYMYRAIAKIQLGDYEGAEIDAGHAIQRNPFVPQAFYARGFTKMKLEKYDEAIEDFSKALEFSPNSSYLLISRMDAYDRAENYEAALEDIEVYSKIHPKNSNILYEKGRIYLSMKDTTAAENAFNQLIEADSSSFIGWSARGVLKLQRKDYDGAYQDYSQAIQQNSTYFGDYVNRGIINVQQKRFMEALSDYEHAIQLEPENKMIYYNRGALRADLGDYNNALEDFERVLKMDTTLMEARYNKALLEIKLKNYREAINDYSVIIDKHPYFLPAYWGIAEAYESMNNIREAYTYRKKAVDLEQNTDNIREKVQADLDAKQMIAEELPEGSTKRRTDLFNRYATQNVNAHEYESKYEDETRGAIQKRFVDVVNERNFVLTYYSNPDGLRQTNLYHPELDAYNKAHHLSGDLKITSIEIPLTNELINKHFSTIHKLTTQLSESSSDADKYFHRAIEYALVQDFESSIADLNTAIALRSNFILAYFMRANIRYKYIEYLRNDMLQSSGNIDYKEKSSTFEKEKRIDIELVLRDLDRVMHLEPEFSFAYYNKANILVAQQDFKAAIYNYNKAIELDKDFAEAYFNRGLTYLYMGEDSKGLSDLSKAGELGIYQSYNLIQRFKN